MKKISVLVDDNEILVAVKRPYNNYIDDKIVIESELVNRFDKTSWRIPLAKEDPERIIDFSINHEEYREIIFDILRIEPTFTFDFVNEKISTLSQMTVLTKKELAYFTFLQVNLGKQPPWELVK